MKKHAKNVVTLMVGIWSPTAFLPPLLLIILFLLYGCNAGKVFYSASDSTVTAMCRYSIHVRHLPVDRMDQLVSDFSGDTQHCQVLQINQVQSAFLFSMEQNDVSIALWATPAGMRTLTHLLMVSGGLVEVVRIQ